MSKKKTATVLIALVSRMMMCKAFFSLTENSNPQVHIHYQAEHWLKAQHTYTMGVNDCSVKIHLLQKLLHHLLFQGPGTVTPSTSTAFRSLSVLKAWPDRLRLAIVNASVSANLEIRILITCYRQSVSFRPWWSSSSARSTSRHRERWYHISARCQ